jgi:RND family efflux transporter MFP subunit
MTAGLSAVVACEKQPPAPALPAPAVRVAIATVQPVAQSEQLLATLDGSTNAEVRPQVTGVIQSVDYKEGTVVAAGTLLFTIDKRPFVDALQKAEGDYASAVAELGKAKADVARYVPLVAERAISQQELDDARAAEQVAAANVKAVLAAVETARLNLTWTRVTSPIRGLAGIAKTRVGNLVNPTALLATVSTVDPIRVSFSLSEQQYMQYASILPQVDEPRQARQRLVELILPDGTTYPYPADHVIIGRAFDPSTNTLLVQALFPNPGDKLRPGMYAQARIHGKLTPRVLVPDAAVQQTQGEYHVDVVNAQGRVEIRAVTIGGKVDHSDIVESGIRPRERVIVAGQQNVRPGMLVTVQEQAPQQASPPGQPAGAQAAPSSVPPSLSGQQEQACAQSAGPQLPPGPASAARQVRQLPDSDAGAGSPAGGAEPDR